jgi:hypothetical protein
VQAVKTQRFLDRTLLNNPTTEVRGGERVPGKCSRKREKKEEKEEKK